MRINIHKTAAKKTIMFILNFLKYVLGFFLLGSVIMVLVIYAMIEIGVWTLFPIAIISLFTPMIYWLYSDFKRECIKEEEKLMDILRK